MSPGKILALPQKTQKMDIALPSIDQASSGRELEAGSLSRTEDGSTQTTSEPPFDKLERAVMRLNLFFPSAPGQPPRFSLDEPKKFRLLDLPAEIRQQIYGHLIRTPHMISLSIHTNNFGLLSILGRLSQTCSFIRHEIIHWLPSMRSLKLIQDPLLGAINPETTLLSVRIGSFGPAAYTSEDWGQYRAAWKVIGMPLTQELCNRAKLWLKFMKIEGSEYWEIVDQAICEYANDKEGVDWDLFHVENSTHLDKWNRALYWSMENGIGRYNHLYHKPDEYLLKVFLNDAETREVPSSSSMKFTMPWMS